MPGLGSSGVHVASKNTAAFPIFFSWQIYSLLLTFTHHQCSYFAIFLDFYPECFMNGAKYTPALVTIQLSILGHYV